jgi:hypothetical protein
MLNQIKHIWLEANNPEWILLDNKAHTEIFKAVKR